MDQVEFLLRDARAEYICTRILITVVTVQFRIEGCIISPNLFYVHGSVLRSYSPYRTSQSEPMNSKYWVLSRIVSQIICFKLSRQCQHDLPVEPRSDQSICHLHVVSFVSMENTGLGIADWWVSKQVAITVLRAVDHRNFQDCCSGRGEYS